MTECKIDSHVPNDDGQSCQCGYFIKTTTPQAEQEKLMKGGGMMNECKIDSHVPTGDGQSCVCGYFKKG